MRSRPKEPTCCRASVYGQQHEGRPDAGHARLGPLPSVRGDLCKLIGHDVTYGNFGPSTSYPAHNVLAAGIPALTAGASGADAEPTAGIVMVLCVPADEGPSQVFPEAIHLSEPRRIQRR
jgi:hypothetical protein